MSTAAMPNINLNAQYAIIGVGEEPTAEDTVTGLPSPNRRTIPTATSISKASTTTSTTAPRGPVKPKSSRSLRLKTSSPSPRP